MRFALSISALVFIGLVGVALAGSSPESAPVQAGCHGAKAPVQAGCHGPQMVAAPAASCHGISLKVPASVAAEGCHGARAGRVTLSERREVRSMARDNYRATKSAGRDAARRGDGVAAVSMSAPSMEMVPASADCSCGCSPCCCQ